jgi:hypothetical protein
MPKRDIQLLIIIYIILLLNCMKDNNKVNKYKQYDPGDQKIIELRNEDKIQINKQFNNAFHIVEKYTNKNLDKSQNDIKLIQIVIDNKFLNRSQTYDLQCLGIAFGMILENNIKGLHWITVIDKYGETPSLKYKETSIIIYPLTMISKRVEESREIDLIYLYNELKKTISEMIKKGY